ncbi:MAG: type I-U CRISPR-associated protein Csb2 [Thermoplasmata archaeon]
MIIIKIVFQNGLFHANPWGRNVNEAVTEWPPSPYRLVRALIDVWKRKLPDYPQDKIEEVLQLLSKSLPVYFLPPARESYIKTYMSENIKNIEDRYKKELIYDEFIIINPKDNILMAWENITISQDQEKLLSKLLSFLNYFGRSESWVSATLYEGETENIRWNCYPAEYNNKYNDDQEMQNIQIATPISREEYDKKSLDIREKGKNIKIDWLNSLMLNTNEIINKKLSIPPALQYKVYKRRNDCFNQEKTTNLSHINNNINSVLFALDSKILPLVTETISLSEKVHVKLMGIHKKLIDESLSVSSKFSGRNPDGTFMLGHKHIYILPLDKNEDGRIDHVLIKCIEPFDNSELLAIDNLKSIWQSGGRPDIQFVPIQWGVLEDITICEKVTVFKSVTPFVPTRHYRKGRGDYDLWLENEIRHEAKNHNLPEPVEIKRLDKAMKKGLSFYWLEFKRNRKRDIARNGYGFELKFSEPVIGPFSIGYGAHFGLGLFMPIKK